MALRIQGEIEKSASNIDHIPQAITLQKPIYRSDASLSRGSITIDNLIIRDSLNHSDFINLVAAFVDSKRLLFSSTANFTRRDDRRKRLLLSLLTSQNWQIKDAFLQARLMKPMSERVLMLKDNILSELE